MNTINFFNAVCNLLFCFEIQAKKLEKKQNQQPYISTNHGPPICLFLFWLLCFFGLDSKAEEQSADHIEKMIVLSRCD